MTLSKYLIVQQIIMGIILALGALLLFERRPLLLKGTRVDLASRVMGAAATIVPIASFIYYFLGLQHSKPEYATATNLSAYCLTSTLLAMGFYILLDKVHEKLMIRIHLGIGFIFPLPLWLGVCFGTPFIANQTLIASYTLFFIVTTIHLSSCLHFYYQELNGSTLAEASGERAIVLNLLRKTIHIASLLILLALCAPPFFYYPLWLGGVFMFSFFMGSIYLFFCYHNVISHSELWLDVTPSEPLQQEVVAQDSVLQEVVVAKKVVAVHATEVVYGVKEVAEPPSTTPLSDEIVQGIQKHLQVWIDNKAFLQADITINHVAKATYTNRTYLSKYINTVYHCSFKRWITQLRMEEAKRLLIEHPERSIASISAQLGFSSAESFSHIFTRCEQVSPLKWRNTEREE